MSKQKIPPPVRHTTVFQLNDNIAEAEQDKAREIASQRRHSIVQTVQVLDGKKMYAAPTTLVASSVEAKQRLIHELSSILTLYQPLTGGALNSAGALRFMEIVKSANIRWVAAHIMKCGEHPCDCAKQDRRTLETVAATQDHEVHSGYVWITSPRSLMALLRHGTHPRALLTNSTQHYLYESVAPGTCASPGGLEHRIQKREDERSTLLKAVLKEYKDICSTVSTQELLKGLTQLSREKGDLPELTHPQGPTTQHDEQVELKQQFAASPNQKLHAAKETIKRQIKGVIDAQTKKLVTQWEQDKKALSAQICQRERMKQGLKSKESIRPNSNSRPTQRVLPEVQETKSTTPTPPLPEETVSPPPLVKLSKEANRKKSPDITHKLKLIQEYRDETNKQRLEQLEGSLQKREERIALVAKQRTNEREATKEELRQRLRSHRALVERNAFVGDYQKLQFVARQAAKEQAYRLQQEKAHREFDQTRRDLMKLELERQRAKTEMEHWRISLEKQMTYEHHQALTESPLRQPGPVRVQKDVVQNFIHSSLKLKNKFNEM